MVLENFSRVPGGVIDFLSVKEWIPVLGYMTQVQNIIYDCTCNCKGDELTDSRLIQMVYYTWQVWSNCVELS